MTIDKYALSFLDENEAVLVGLAKNIWNQPELALQENYASAALADLLEGAGFDVERGVGGMPTAFAATWGHGKPVIGLLGEYDALPGLSQQVVPREQPVQAGGPGHGCGHNLLGVGSLGAALAVKHATQRGGLQGTLRFYGCPAEETLVGKVFMARAGAFDDLDAALTWHPGYANGVWESPFTAMNSFKVSFYGVAAHAASSPEAGRSALDGVQLMDVGVNYLREHIIQDARIHCVITNGGEAPNVVPPFAQVWYYVRAPTREQVDQIYGRMLAIAEGGALMSATRYEVDLLTGCHQVLPNACLGTVLSRKLAEVGPPAFTAEEKALAHSLQATLPMGAVDGSLEELGLTREAVGDPLSETLTGPYGKSRGGSTDVGDVSFIVPTAQFTTCCSALGTPGHSWQFSVTSGSSIGHKGMMVAARVLALATIELCTTPELVETAWQEFREKTRGREYRSPLPDRAVPH